MSSFILALRPVIQFVASCVRSFREASIPAKIVTLAVAGLVLWYTPDVVSMIWDTITAALGEALSAIMPYVILALIAFAVIKNNE